MPRTISRMTKFPVPKLSVTNLAAPMFIVAAMVLAVPLAPTVKGQVVLDMPAPPPVLPDRAAAGADEAGDDSSDRVGARPRERSISTGDLALMRYARARTAPREQYGPADRSQPGLGYGGWRYASGTGGHSWFAWPGWSVPAGGWWFSWSICPTSSYSHGGSKR